MIESDAGQALTALADRLVRKARKLGEARAQGRQLASSQPDKAWRSARLLWPLFTKG